MKLYDWDDFSGDSGVEDTPLLISTRSQSLILSALEKLQPRWAWTEVDDADWDDIEGAIASAIFDVTEEVDMTGTFHGVRAWRDTNYTSTSTTLWQPIEFNQISATADYAHGAGSTNYLEAPESGWYLVSAGVVFNANSSNDTFIRQARIVNNSGSVLCFDSGSIASQPIGLNMATLWYMEAGEYLQLEIKSNIPNIVILSQNQNSPVLSMERVR
jgi:hypothetical protein